MARDGARDACTLEPLPVCQHDTDGRGESFSTDYASPTEPNTQAQALADKHESHTPDTHMRNTHINTPTLQ